MRCNLKYKSSKTVLKFKKDVVKTSEKENVSIKNFSTVLSKLRCVFREKGRPPFMVSGHPPSKKQNMNILNKN